MRLVADRCSISQFGHEVPHAWLSRFGAYDEGSEAG
jgi:hypothetical protein